MADLYLDADVDADLADWLRARSHDVLTTHEVGRRRAGDEEQLVYAAERGRILVTHNGEDFELLQRAWRFWTDIWNVTPRALHAGILVVPQPPLVPLDRIGREIDAFVRSHWPLSNRCYGWSPGRGWVPLG